MCYKLLWRFSTACYGTVRFTFGVPLGTVPGTWYFFQYHLDWGTIEPYRYQNMTCKLCWSLIGQRESSLPTLLNLQHQTQQTQFKSAQPAAKDRTQLVCFEWAHLFLTNKKNGCFVVCWVSTDVPLFDSLGADPARAWWSDAGLKSYSGVTAV